VKGADWEVLPVWSRSNSPRLVPEGSATIQVNEVPVRPDQETRAGEDGLLPGTTLCIGAGDQLREIMGDREKPTKKKGPGTRKVSTVL
jgi:hypothetical protein